jgi:ribonuclease HI
MNNQIEIYFDGGCRPTNPGNKYGSFEVQLDCKQVFKACRIEFGFGTNNEAEFNALNEALKWTCENLTKAGLSPRHYHISMFSDSTIVINRIKGENISRRGEASQRMAALTSECLSRLAYFRGWNITWRGRQNNVDRFGH